MWRPSALTDLLPPSAPELHLYCWCCQAGLRLLQSGPAGPSRGAAASNALILSQTVRVVYMLSRWTSIQLI